MATAKKDPEKSGWKVELRDKFDEAAVILLEITKLEGFREQDARALARRINKKALQLNQLH